MATQYINQVTANATVAGQQVNFQSNAVTAELFDISSVTLVKTQSTGLVVSGGTMNYTVTITNLTLAPVANFNFKDILPNGMTYTAGTFKVNAVSQTPTVTGQDLTFTIASLAVGVTVVTFDTTVA